MDNKSAILKPISDYDGVQANNHATMNANSLYTFSIAQGVTLWYYVPSNQIYEKFHPNNTS